MCFSEIGNLFEIVLEYVLMHILRAYLEVCIAVYSAVLWNAP